MNTLKKLLSLVGLWLAMSMAAHAGTVTYIYTDNQGTPLAEADAQGNVTATFDYRPYGSQALGTPPKGPGYTGHVNDPDTGLVYMQARYYDPLAGRFLSVDPNSGQPPDTFVTNRYAYGNNNPIKNTDPTGKCIDACVVEIYVAAIVVAAAAAYVSHEILGNMRDHPIINNPVIVKSESSTATTTNGAKEKVQEGTTPASGKSGIKGEREGTKGGETAAWDKISGKETVYDNGTKVKELVDGGHADLHSSTKSPDYPQGTQTIKIRNPDGDVVTTVRYPAPSPPPEATPN